MRRIATLVLIVAGLGSLVSRAEAQIVSPPTIRSVNSTSAFAPGRIVIHGTSLGIVTQVLIAGEVVPIVKNTGSRLSVQPPPEDPGFATLELRSILGPVYRIPQTRRPGSVRFEPRSPAFFLPLLRPRATGGSPPAWSSG